jgi:hypothetical protein
MRVKKSTLLSHPVAQGPLTEPHVRMPMATFESEKPLVIHEPGCIEPAG